LKLRVKNYRFTDVCHGLLSVQRLVRSFSMKHENFNNQTGIPACGRQVYPDFLTKNSIFTRRRID
jgi:hypothetical protein